MTKLGITPGVHGEDQLQKEDELTTVKIDPKVFTILQPVGTPPPTVLKAPLREQKSGACKWLMLITLISSATLLTLYLCSLYVADQPLGKIFVITTPEIETMPTQPPQAEAQKSGEPVVILPVKTVDGGSENSSDRINDGAVIQQQQQQLPQQPDQPQFDPWVAAAQARFFQMQQEAQMWRWRRVQQALYEQQMMREQWQQQQAQQAYMAEQARAHWIARAQWEAAREEAGRAEQMRQVQMAQQAQQQEQEQAQQARAAQWQQYYWQQQQQAQQAQQQQQQQQQPQQQPQQDWQQYYWQQQQALEQQAQQQMMMQQQQQQQQQMEQPQQPHHPRFILLRHLTRIQPVSLSFRMPEQPDNNELPQPAIHDRIYQQLQKKAQGMEFNAPNRPIWTAITPTPETPTTRFDEEAAFQENLKKSLEKEAQEATTPTAQEEDEKPHDLEGEMIKDIFSALASAAKDVDASTTTTEAPSTPASENVFKPFAGEQDKKIDEDVSIFKPFAPEEDKESDSDKAAEKSGFSAFNADGAPKEQEEQKPEGFEPKTTMIDGSALPVVIFEDRFPKLEERTTTPETPMPAPSSAEVEPEEIHTEGEIHPSEMPTSAEMGPQDGPAPTELAEGPSSSEVPQDGPAPTMMIPEGTSSSEEHPAEAPMPSPEGPSSSEEHPAGPSSAETASEAPKEDENNEEHDPLAAFLKYFEQEARRMAEIRAAAAAEAGGSSDEMPVEGEAAQQPAVDEPEPHFKPAVPITV